MRVLGVDPGSRFLGYGIVELRRNQSLYITSGVVRAGTTEPLHERLLTIFVSLRAVVDAHQPDVVAVEGVFTHKNSRSALILGHARGVALLLAAEAGLPVHEYAPARVKKSVGVGGNDSKESVARMVSRLLTLPHTLERADAYDALAVALCHVHRVRVPAGLKGKPTVRSNPSSPSTDFFARLKPATVRAVR
jgi:crossover junction endodeoxyribonuclease RuvC